VPTSDSVAYDQFARNLVDYGVYGWTKEQPFTFWPPGTSFLYAAVFRLFGYGYSKIVVLNILLSCAIIVVTGRVAARLYSKEVALFAMLVLAAWPTLIMFTTLLASELPYLFLTMAAIDAWTIHNRSPALRGTTAGILLGAASLVRPLALMLPFVYGAAVLFERGHSRQRWCTQLTIIAACITAMAVLISPWTWRNYQLYGDPVLISTNGGATLWMGNSPGARGDYAEIPERLDGLNDNEMSKVLGAEAKQFILSDPLGFVVRTIRKIGMLYSNESIGVNWNAKGIQNAFGSSGLIVLKRFTQITWAIIFLLSITGGLILFRKQRWRAFCSPIVFSIFFYTVVHGVIVSQDRYHVVFAAQLTILAGVSLAALFERRAINSEYITRVS